MNDLKYLKIVIVGDGAVGKTALVITYVNGTFPADYLPTVADKFQKNMSVDNSLYSLSLWDTAGQEEYQRLRVLSYPDTDIFLICFSTVSMSSFNNVREKWIFELNHYCPTVPKVLVGTKIDLRKEVKDEETKIITTDMGKAMASQQGIEEYLECSAKTNEGVEILFQQVVRILMEIKRKKLEEQQKKKKICIVI